MKKNNKGQAALVMIVIMAMAFIFYSIELNWGRIADLKITTWIAAHSTASTMASNMASYAEKLLHEYILIQDPNQTFDYYPDPEYTSDGYPFTHGDLKTITACQGNWLLLRIIVAIIVIVLVALSEGTLWYVAVIVLTVLFAITFILEFAVILPMEQALWNKLMKNMQPIDQFRESGVQTGLIQMASDNVNIPDRFDMNLNGKWGFNPESHPEPYQPNDTVSRVAFFYTERLKHLKAQTVYPNSAYQDFLNYLGGFTGTTNVGGNATVNGLLTVDTSPNATNPYTGLSLNSVLFCNASRTRYAMLDQFNSIGLTTTDPTSIFETLKNQGWAKTDPAQANTVQLSADFTDQRIMETANQLFGSDAPMILAVLQNDQKSNFNPICDPACTHDATVQNHSYSLGWTYGNSTAAVQKQYVPDECQACVPTTSCSYGQCDTPCPNFSNDAMDANNYRLMYNPFLLNPIPPNAINPADKGYSWGARFGHDDELGKEKGIIPYNPKNTSGIVFLALDQMDHLQDDPELQSLSRTGATDYDNGGGKDGNPVNASYSSSGFGGQIDPVPADSDTVQKIVNFKAPLSNCSYYDDSASGLFWKKGADRYCAGNVQQYLKKDPQTGQIKTEEEIISTYYPGELPLDEATNPAKHWPYDDCTYMHSSSGPPGGNGDPALQIACPDGSANQWPQDRLDAIVYGLPALIGLNQALQGLNGQQLNMGINQWYPEVAKFIAPKCTPDPATKKDPCAELQVLYPSTQKCTDLCQGQGCANMDNNPVIQRLVTEFGHNSATCNPQFHGYILQWWYDLQNWTKQTYDWLYTIQSGGMCTGPLVSENPFNTNAKPILSGTSSGYSKIDRDGTHPGLPPAPGGSQATNVVDCLYQKSYFYKELDDCWFGTTANNNLNNDEPVSTPFPTPVNNENVGTIYPYMSFACKKVIRLAQDYPVNFVTTVPSDLDRISDSLDNTQLANLIYPKNSSDDPGGYGAENNDAQSKRVYEEIRGWVEANQISEVATKARYGQLSDLSYKVIDMMNLFNEGAADFYGFINPQTTTAPAGTGVNDQGASTTNGAVIELMGTRADNGITNTLKLPRLPSFVIYGWQDAFNASKKVIANGVESPTGQWHLARMEVSQPKDLPIINANTEWGWHGISGPMYNCLTAENIRGDVWARATRWDAPKGEIANFGNKGLPIWNFTYMNMTSRTKEGQYDLLSQCPSDYLQGHPQVVDSDPNQVLNQFCRGKNIGITTATQDGYKVTANSSRSAVYALPGANSDGGITVNSDGTISDIGGFPSDVPMSEIESEFFNLNDAFMFNYNPFDPGTGQYVDASDDAKNCYCVANYLLATQGVMTYSGAHFAIPEKMTQGALSDKGSRYKWHVEIKFNELSDDKSQVDIFPDNGDTMPDDLSTEDTGN